LDETSSLNDFYKIIVLNEDVSEFHLQKNSSSIYEKNNSKLSLYSDDYFSNINLLTMKNFNIFGNNLLYTQSEDNFDSQKSLYFVFNQNNSTPLFTNEVAFFNNAYSTVLDTFRSDYDEFSFVLDEKNKENSNMKNCINLIKHFNFDNVYQSLIFTENQLDAHSTLRNANSVNLRGTARNAIVSYNAIQKVFRTRLDENRSNARMQDFNNSFVKQPFVTAPRITFENLLGKNKLSYFETNVFKDNFKKYFNSFYFLNSSLNFQFF